MGYCFNPSARKSDPKLSEKKKGTHLFQVTFCIRVTPYPKALPLPSPI